MSFKDLVKTFKEKKEKYDEKRSEHRERRNAELEQKIARINNKRLKMEYDAKLKKEFDTEKKKLATLNKNKYDSIFGGSRPQSMFGNGMNLSVGMAQTPQRGWSVGSSSSTKRGKVKDERRRWRI